MLAEGGFFMGSNHVLEIEVENHLANLDKLVHSIDADRDQLSLSGKDLMRQLRNKVKASHDMLLVAKLLSEPARESIFSKVRDSLSDVEEFIASQLGVKTNVPHSACSSEELAYASHVRPNGRP
jgi:hypothetical protein